MDQDKFTEIVINRYHISVGCEEGIEHQEPMICLWALANDIERLLSWMP